MLFLFLFFIFFIFTFYIYIYSKQVLPSMAYSINGHISYILEANSKRLIRENKKRNRSYVEKIEWGVAFFLF